MVVGEVAESTDLLVIGGGPGGYAAALHAAHRGVEVTLVEATALGGVCLNVGCIPSKALIHAAELAHLDGQRVMGVEMRASASLSGIRSAMDDVVAGLTSGVAGLLRAAGVSVIEGTARFSRPNRVAVVSGPDVHHLEFQRCVVATGSRPTLPAMFQDCPLVLDSTGALALEQSPERLVVIGGGYIGVELGTSHAKLGSSVTIVEMADRVLPAMDPGLSRLIQRRLRQLGVDLRLDTQATGCDAAGIVLGDGTRIDADAILVAVGRVPNTDDLGLQLTGAVLDPGGMVIVDKQRLATPTIAAIGDIVEGPALAHKATAEAEVAVAALLGDAHASFDPAAIPEVVFSDPEVAQVGLTPSAAAAAGVAVQTFRFPFTAGSRSRTVGATDGFVELVADPGGTIVGGLLAGHGVSELAGDIATAVEMAATAEEVAATIRPHPSYSEAITEAALGLTGRPLHVPLS